MSHVAREIEVTRASRLRIACAVLRARSLGNNSSLIDLLAAALAITAYIAWIWHFQYRGLLGEDDLYRVLVGLLDGARTGAELASANHYGKAFSFGYIAAIYQWAGAATLADPDRLMRLIGLIGFWSAAAGCVLFGALAWMLCGLRVAALAVMLFALSPMMLELGTSGHPILPAFALFAVAALCLLAPVHGFAGAPLQAAGALLLLAALTVRAEVGLAVPFLVVMRVDLTGQKAFLRSAVLRGIAPVASVAVFLALKHLYADSSAGSGMFLSFLQTFIRVREIPVGVYVFVSSCGVVTTLAGVAACVALVRRMKPRERREELYPKQAAILALILFPLAFWIADPRPGRHFILCLAGMGLFVGWAAARRFAHRPLTTYALVLAIVAGNQAFAALSGPLLLRHAPSKILAGPSGERRLARGVPTGWALSYHRALVEEQMRTTAFAALVAHSCDEKTLVMSLDATQIFANLYAGSGKWDPTEQHLGRFPMLEARIGGRAVLVLSENEGWPADAAALALADPVLRDYKLIRDPNSLSVYDHAAIPGARAAHLGCGQ